MIIGRHNLKLAAQNLRAAKARSFVTMLGIIIGVTAAILMVSLGQGVKKQVTGQLGRYVKDAVAIQPGATDNSGVFGGLSGVSSALLTQHDLQIVQKTPGVSLAVPLATSSGSMTGDHTVTSPYIVATTADLTSVLKQTFASGGMFDPGSDSQSVVLGSSIAQRLFNDNAPLGQGLTWRGQRFMVAGVFNDFHAPPFSLEANFNNAVFVPYPVAQHLSESALGIYQILARTDTTVPTPRVMDRIKGNLVAAHAGAQDVSVRLATANNASADQTLHLLTLLIIGAALITLIVGGVGIMDVMLVSVTERMHEIGIRKAVGATNKQILRQFVAEAFLLSVYGAIIGILVSLVLIGLLRLFSGLQPVIVWQILVIAPLVAIVVGVLFGAVPALKAARKDPIDALRHE